MIIVFLLGCEGMRFVAVSIGEEREGRVTHHQGLLALRLHRRCCMFLMVTERLFLLYKKTLDRMRTGV